MFPNLFFFFHVCVPASTLLDMGIHESRCVKTPALKCFEEPNCRDSFRDFKLGRTAHSLLAWWTFGAAFWPPTPLCCQGRAQSSALPTS
jgi:hypothetical protein